MRENTSTVTEYNAFISFVLLFVSEAREHVFPLRDQFQRPNIDTFISHTLPPGESHH